MTTIVFEFHGQLQRLAGGDEYRLSLATPATLAAALEQLAIARPELATALARCACAVGDRLLLRRERLDDGERIALLPPVAGG